MCIEDSLLIYHFAGAWSSGHSPEMQGQPAASLSGHPILKPALKGLRDGEKGHSSSCGYYWRRTFSWVSTPEGGCFAHPIEEIKVWKLYRSPGKKV